MTGPVFSFDQRPVINLSILCSPIGPTPKQLCFTLPGDFEICPSTGHINIGTFEYAKLALGLASTALAPLGPVFRILDVVLSLAKCLAVIPEVIGPPPRPQKLVELLKDLADKVLGLARLVPALSVPIMVLQLIDMLIATFDGAAEEFFSLAHHLQRIQQAEINVNQAPGLLPIITCAHASLAQQMDNLEHVLAAVNPVIDLINLFVELVPGLRGNPHFPLKPFQGLPIGALPFEMGVGVQAVASELHLVRSYIPI